MNFRLLLFFIALCLTSLSCSTKKETTSLALDSLAVADSLKKLQPDKVEVVVAKDSALDYQGRFIAGLNQVNKNAFSGLENDPYWKEYKNAVDTGWAKMYTNRLSKMKEWEAGTLSSTVSDTLSLFYPFSGPDFLHAHYLYPKTNEFILGALEPIIDIPALDSIKEKQRDKFLDSLNHSLRDIFYKSYFITTHMQNDLKQIRGVLPALYFFLERSGHELLEQRFITLDADGNLRGLTSEELKKRIPGVAIKFRDLATKQIKTLYYFNLDLSDKGLLKRPEFLTFVKKRAPFNTFVKSASYLMTNPNFATMRNFILGNTKTLFQDDTGVPYRFLKSRMDFTVQLYGEYTKPVKDFGAYTYQADLDSAYKATANKQPLPFSLGYHWSTKIQNYMLATKIPVANSKNK
jgi:hypothetical protein